MKHVLQTARSVFIILTAAATIALSPALHAQIQSTNDLPLVQPDAVPQYGGTFWKLSSFNAAWGRFIEPPLPFNLASFYSLTNADFYLLNSNSYVLDDKLIDWPATYAAKSADLMTMSLMFGDSLFFEGSDSGGDMSPDFQSPDYGTNLWIAQVGILSSYLVGIVTNSQADILYEIQSKQSLPQTNWVSEGFLYGSEVTNWTPMAVEQGDRTNLFLRIRSWVDSNNSGIPDWWWLTYFGQATNVSPSASAAGDGFSNLQKFQMGLNPTNYYNPNGVGGFVGCFDITGTNVILEWSNAPGPVTGYVIQRGFLDTNSGNFIYSPLATVSSNAIFFADVGANTNNAAQDYAYQLAAVYAGGSFSTTNAWYVRGFHNLGNHGMPYGPPLPSSSYVNTDSTGTNILLSWTPASSSAATNCLVSRGIYNSTNYTWAYKPITNVSATTTNIKIFGVVTNDSNWTDVYEVQAVYPGGGLSAPASSYPDWQSQSSINVGANTNGPAAPGSFYGYPNSTGTNIVLTWSPMSGAATNYLIYGGVLDYDTELIIYHRLGRLGAGTNSFTVVGAIDGSGNNLYYIYNIVAVYTNSSLSQSAAWYPSNGAPAPDAFSAYVDSTGTNVMLAWTPAPAAVSGYLIQASQVYGDSYFDLASVSASTFSLEDVDRVDEAESLYGLEAVVYQLQAVYPGGGLSPAVTATVATNVPAPSGVSAAVDSTGTNVLISWTAAVGPVTGYTILRGTYNSATGNYSYTQIGTVSAGTTSVQDTGAVSGNNLYNNMYEVRANYAGSILSLPVFSSVVQSPTPAADHNLNVTAQMVRNQTGRWQLMFSSIPSKVQKIAFYWYIWDYFDDIGPLADSIESNNGVPLTTENDLAVSSITNGIYVIPDFLMTNWFPNNLLGKIAMIQPIGTNNQYGTLSQAGFQPYDSPTFVDGRQHLKQNLLYELRAGSISQPNVRLSENYIWWNPFFVSEEIPVDTNYVESSFFHWSIMFKGYGPPMNIDYLKMDDVWPITANYELHQNLYDPNYSGTPFDWQPQGGYDGYSPYTVSFQGTLAAIPASAVLGVGDPYWISQDLANMGDVGAYTNGNSLSLQSGLHNLFGLAFTNALVNQGGVDYLIYPYQTYPPITLSPNGSVTISNADSFFDVNVFFSQTADPSLLLTNYYFAPVNTPGTALPNEIPQIQRYPLPALTGFASTNKTGLMITSVGTPTTIGGWAKFAIQNGNPNKFAYLGQYYVTNAFVLTNGIITTNTTGVVSPYGDFFPTQPGAVAMITMPDIDTGAQGTGVVRVVALSVDANHDGTLDFAYQGPDFVSLSKPFRFWVNDNSDFGEEGGDGIPDQPRSVADGTRASSINYDTGERTYTIQGVRDLVDYFPVYLNIGSLFQSNALSAGISATDTNYHFVLSQADNVLRFVYTDLTPTNYMNFLQDTNKARSLASATTTTISNIITGGVALRQSFLGGIATSNQGIILVEAAAATTQPLVLTIYHGTNQIAQTQLYLSISGVEQMFRHKNLLLYPDSSAPPERLTDSDVPNEPETIDKNFVFLHGYNVNPRQARGVFADTFKRMYWSGSHAKFYGVTYRGYESQWAIGVTPNLQTNIVNAFLTAPNLKNFIATLTNGPTVTAAHSLGNMVILSALSDWNANIQTHFMIDAAVAIEALAGDATQNTNMIHPDWDEYASRLTASEWHGLFPTNDYRSTLTWRGRFPNLGSTEVYNFYSSGEEVLREHIGQPPGDILGTVAAEVGYLITHHPVGVFTWAMQEKTKGRATFNGVLGSTHGGWGWNEDNDQYYWHTNGGDGGQEVVHLAPSLAALLPDSQLRTNAFFDMTFDTALYTTNSSGSAYAQTNRNRILSDAIPALTSPVGANSVPDLDEIGVPHNFDMQALYENGWPAGRPARSVGASAAGEWHHSDFREVAYPFTYKMFDKLVNLGDLK